MALKDLLSSKASFYFIELDKIKIEEGFNARKDFGDIQGLAKDIAANGLTQPLIVRVGEDRNSVYLIDGERRLRAIKYINEHNLIADGGMLDVKCMLEEKGSNDETRLLKVFSTGANAKPLEEIEQADVIYRLTSIFHMKVKSIAQRIGRPMTYVTHLLELHEAPFDVREAVRAKKISPTAARVLAKASKEKQKEVLEKGAKSGMVIKVREVEKVTKGTSTQISSRVIKNKIKKIEGMIQLGSVNVKEYQNIIRGLELALGFWELS